MDSKKPEHDDAEQSKRFIDAARKAEAVKQKGVRSALSSGFLLRKSRSGSVPKVLIQCAFPHDR